MKKVAAYSALLLASFTNAMAQAPTVSSIVVRPDGNTQQTTTTPVQNQDGSTGTSTTTTINDSNGQSATIDAHGHITNYHLKENCQASLPAPQISLTYVCYPANGVLYVFDVEWLLYDCHPPDSDIHTMQRRFAVRFSNTGTKCNPDQNSYTNDVLGAQMYGETWPPATGGGDIKTDLSGSTTTANGGSTTTATGGGTTTGTDGGAGTNGGTTTNTGTNGTTNSGTTTGTSGTASTGRNTSSSSTTTGRRPRKQITKKTGTTVSQTPSQTPSSSSNASVPIGVGIGVGIGLGMGMHGGGDHGDFHGGDRR
jgi:hypothetical protein